MWMTWQSPHPIQVFRGQLLGWANFDLERVTWGAAQGGERCGAAAADSPVSRHDNLCARPAASRPRCRHWGLALDTTTQLNTFLSGVERRAYRIALMSLRNPDDALDAVQEAMFQLVKSYSQRPEPEWLPLFYRILQSRVRDCQRRRMVRNRYLSFFGGQRDSEDAPPDPIEAAPDPSGRDPSEQVGQEEAMRALEIALRELPGRQREAFVLRILEGLDVSGTAKSMGCSEGSVKTHLSRAVHSLRETLGEHWL